MRGHHAGCALPAARRPARLWPRSTFRGVHRNDIIRVHAAQAGRNRPAGALASDHSPAALGATWLRARVPGFRGRLEDTLADGQRGLELSAQRNDVLCEGLLLRTKAIIGLAIGNPGGRDAVSYADRRGPLHADFRHRFFRGASGGAGRRRVRGGPRPRRHAAARGRAHGHEGIPPPPHPHTRAGNYEGTALPSPLPCSRARGRERTPQPAWAVVVGADGGQLRG